jgi:hypothetical protein
MKISLLAFDSLGTRSMATKVVTDDVAILIDPSASLAPKRHGLPPSSRELERLGEHLDLIASEAGRCQVLIVTHYHYDHYDPDRPRIFNGKIALVKDPKLYINLSQKARAAKFLGIINPMELRYCDSSKFKLGETYLAFSKPVHHGSDPRLGYVVEVSIREGDEVLVFTSDVEGPVSSEQADFILGSGPKTVILDGPMTYMLGYRYSEESLKSSIERLRAILSLEDLSHLVMDHHFMRDLKYRERPGIQGLYDLAEENGVRLVSAAEFMGKEPEMLEALRGMEG